MSCRAVSDLMYSFSFPKAYVDVGCCYFDQIFLEVVSGVLQCYCWMTVRTEVSPGEVVFVLKSVYEGVSCKAVRVFFSSKNLRLKSLSKFGLRLKKSDVLTLALCAGECARPENVAIFVLLSMSVVT